MNVRIEKGNSLQTAIAVFGIAVLAVAAVCAGRNHVHIQDWAQRGLLRQAAVVGSGKTGPTTGSAASSLHPERARSFRHLPGGAAPIVSATLGQHDFSYTVKTLRDSYATENPANQLSASFSSGGLELRQGRGRWGMRLSGWGYDQNVQTSPNVTPRATGNRVEYARSNLTEWYLNGPLGLEQSFRVARAPWGNDNGPHTLAFSFALDGNWRNFDGARSEAVALADSSGRPAIRYGGLTVHDASGRELTSWLELRGHSMRLEVSAQGAEFPVTIDPTYSQVAQLSATGVPSGAPSNLGSSASVSDDGKIVVVSACGFNPSTDFCSTAVAGAAYVFVEPPTGWSTTMTPSASLLSSDSMQGDNFGYAVAISSDGGTIVVSALPGGGSSPGAAYVFLQPTGGWQNATEPIPQTAKLMPSDSSSVIDFTPLVAISGDGKTILARSYNDSTQLGEVYIFTAPAGNWLNAPSPTTPVNEIGQLAPTETRTDSFGYGIGISGDASVIVLGDGGANSFEGEAYVFLMHNGQWASASAEDARLRNSDPSKNGFFGTAIAVDQHGDTIAVGAEEQNSDVGEAYVFTEPTNGWTTTSTLTQTTLLTSKNFDGTGTDFGLQLSITDDGTMVVVGSEGDGIYQYSPGGGWPTGSIDETIVYDIPVVEPLGTDFLFGYISGGASANNNSGVLFVGAPANNPNGNSTYSQSPGAIFVYENPSPPLTILPPPNSQATAGVLYTGAFTASGGNGMIAFSPTTELPPGFTLASNGTLSGIPTVTGPLVFDVTATDQNNDTASVSFTLTIVSAPLAITTATLPGGQLNVAYPTTTLTATGGTAPYIWTFTGLPPGLSGSADGAISGTPTAAGPFDVSASVTDSASVPQTTVRTYPLTIAGLVPPQIVKTFGVGSIPLDGITSLNFSISNPNSAASLTGISFTDSFPAGLAIAANPNLTDNGCGGTVSGTPGTTSATLSGGVLAGGASCTISLKVTGTNPGTLNNSVTVISTATGTGNTSIASLVVQSGLFSPTSGTQGQTLNVTFTGSGFVAGVTTVQFGSANSGITVNSFTVMDSGDAVANITISPTAKSVLVTVTVTTGTKQTVEGTFTVLPATISVSPAVGTQGETLDVTLTGLTFVPGMTVQFGSSTSGIHVNSLTIPNATEAIANISIALSAPTRTVELTVVSGQSTFKQNNAFSVGPAALILSPNTGTQGETLDVTLTGLTFVPGMTVQFGSSTSGIHVNSLTIPNATEAIANISIALNAPQKPVTVTVTDGQSSFGQADAFKVGQAALILSPNTGTQGATLDVTLTGLTFVPGMTVQFGSSTSGIHVNSLTITNATEAIANISIALNAPQQPVNVTVTNGQSSFGEAHAFTVGQAALVLSPNTGTQGQTLDVTLTGLTFVPGMTVQFGSPTSGITVNSLTIPNATEAIANITIGWNASPNPLEVTVTNGQSSFRENDAFTVGPPALTLSPNQGQVGQTLNVVMSGLPFGSGPASFSFQSVSKASVIRSFKLNSLTPIDATDAIANITITSNASPGQYEVTVTFLGPPGLVFRNVGEFTVLAP